MDVVLLLRLCGSAVFTTLGYVGHAWFKASDYNQKARHDEWTTCAGYTVQEFVGVALATFGFPLAWVCVVGLSINVAKRRRGPLGEPRFKLPALAGLAAAAAAGAISAWADASDVLRCGVVGCYRLTDADLAEAGPSAYAVTMGVFLVVACGCVALLNLKLLATAARAAWTGPKVTAGDDAHDALVGGIECSLERSLLHSEDYSTNNTRSIPLPSPRRAKLKTVGWTLFLLGVLASLAFLTTVLPNGWEALTAAKLKAYAAAGKSSSNAPEGDGARTAEAWFTTTFKVLKPGGAGGQGRLVAKVYPDVLMYYAFLAALAVVACLANVFPHSLGRLLKRRFRVPGPLAIKVPAANPDNKARPPPPVVLASVGGECYSFGVLVVLACFAALLTCYARYWFVDHWYHNKPSANSVFETRARATGQLANLGLALLLLPVARHSVLNEAFGVAWEQALFAHIYVGYATLLLFVVHACCWYKVYAENNIFPDDILEVPMYYPLNGQPKSHGRCADNWTVPLATITVFAALVCMGVLAHYEVRRRNFEAFYYAHHVFLAIYATALWHAASCWYLVLGGLAHWAVDHVLRTSKAADAWHVRVLEPRADGVVHVEAEPAAGRVFAYAPGQYAFLAFHDVSSLEWHPFTLSAAPSDARASNRIAFDIKAMVVPGGKPTFTEKLRTLASRVADGAVDAKSLRIAVDGPHGAAFDERAHDDILLVAGGIGVTPCHAIFRELYRRAADDADGALDPEADGAPRGSAASSGGRRDGSLVKPDGPGRVTLLWVVRDRSVLELFAPTLRAAANDDLGGRFCLKLFVDSERGRDHWGSGDAHKGIPFAHGRPDCVRAIDDVARGGAARPHVFVCGPPGLSAACSAACLDRGVDFHSEVFAF